MSKSIVLNFAPHSGGEVTIDAYALVMAITSAPTNVACADLTKIDQFNTTVEAVRSTFGNVLDDTTISSRLLDVFMFNLRTLLEISWYDPTLKYDKDFFNASGKLVVLSRNSKVGWAGWVKPMFVEFDIEFEPKKDTIHTMSKSTLRFPRGGSISLVKMEDCTIVGGASQVSIYSDKIVKCRFDGGLFEFMDNKVRFDKCVLNKVRLKNPKGFSTRELTFDDCQISASMANCSCLFINCMGTVVFKNGAEKGFQGIQVATVGNTDIRIKFESIETFEYMNFSETPKTIELVGYDEYAYIMPSIQGKVNIVCPSMVVPQFTVKLHLADTFKLPDQMQGALNLYYYKAVGDDIGTLATEVTTPTPEYLVVGDLTSNIPINGSVVNTRVMTGLRTVFSLKIAKRLFPSVLGAYVRWCESTQQNQNLSHVFAHFFSKIGKFSMLFGKYRG